MYYKDVKYWLTILEFMLVGIGFREFKQVVKLIAVKKVIMIIGVLN
jgi:hypothetical protein